LCCSIEDCPAKDGGGDQTTGQVLESYLENVRVGI